MTTVLITGANRGIGLEMTRLYSDRGDSVLACCRRPDEAGDVSALTGDVHLHALDVASADSVQALADTLEGRTIDVLINNAGIGGPPPREQTAKRMDFDGWAETFAVNSMGPVRVMQALLPNLQKSSEAKVVNITSQMGALSLDMTMAYAYCASKAALNKFMKLAATELGREGIHVCLIHPGWVQTDMGGEQADLTPRESAEGIVAVVDQLDADNQGRFWKWNGEQHGW